MAKNKTLTLGSLFDGSGGFPLGGIITGITPVWASEIEPFPVRVTEKRMPGVIQLGDISKINGADIPPVDIITFGSPCQDMSIAGKREGLDGARSGLFFEAIRIIREMREKTDGKYPRFAVWENVKGAFSSNKGEDFRCVIEEFCRITEPDFSVPRCDKWKNAGCVLGESFSVAWRLFDAQYWGIPQRRERIYLCASFVNPSETSSADILFEPESLSGHFKESFHSWESFTRGASEGIGKAGCVCLNDQGGSVMDVSEDKTGTLRAETHGHLPVVAAAGFCTEHSAKARGIGYQEETAPTLRAGNVPAAMMFENHSQDTRYRGPLDVAQPVTATYGSGGNNQPFVVQPPQAFGVCSKTSHSMLSDNPKSGFYEAETSRCLDANGGNPSCNQGGIAVVEGCYDVRLTSEGTRNARNNVYETEKSRTLSTNGNPPDGNQGGVAVVAVEGNGTRPSHKGDGYKEADVMYTLNATEQHAVAFADKAAPLSANDGPKGPSSQMLKNPEENFVAETAYGIDRIAYNAGMKAGFNFAVNEEVEPTMVSAGPNAVGHPIYHSSKNSHHTKFTDEKAVDTLVASDFKDPPTVTEEPYYIVRRLTPIECARLQGFPDWWCDGLASEEPSDEEVARWMEIFETHRKALGKTTKPKTENQVRKWLKGPYSDSAAYRMWGNGVALPNVVFVLSGIVYYAQSTEEML